jgi:gluconolactonase
VSPAPEIVSPQPRFAEGPVWCAAADGVGASVVCTSVSEGALFRVDVATGSVARLAVTGGGANGAVPCADGGFLVTQNGGLDFAAIGLFDDPPVCTPAQPGLQRVRADGRVETLTPDVLQAPNDLVVAPDGTVFFTDPPPWPLPDDARGRVWAFRRDGALDLVADGFYYPNGIGIDRDGALVVVENGLMGKPVFGLVRITPDDGHDLFAARTGDGFCFDVDGRLYVAGEIHGVTVLEPDGRIVERLEIPGSGVTTNCCFGGDDLRTLFATEAVPGGLVAWEHMPVAGAPVVTWPGPGPGPG